MPWRTIDGETVAPATMPQLEVLLRGVFDKRRFLDLRPAFHRVRGRRRQCRHQKTGGLPPVSRRQYRRGGNHARRQCRGDGIEGEQRRLLRQKTARRRNRRQARRRGLAHAGIGQVADDGILRRAAGASSRRWKIPRSSFSPTGTTSTTSFSARSPAAMNCSGKSRCRRRTGTI